MLGDETGPGAMGLVVFTDPANRQGIASPTSGLHRGDNPSAGSLSDSAGPVTEVPVTLQVRLSPEQNACYESLMEKLRNRGTREPERSCSWPGSKQ